MVLRVALNLVYLVPGEVGGMETYARELIPRLAAMDGVELLCLVNCEAAEAGGGPWGEACPMEVVPVRARSRVEWVRGEQQHVPRMTARAGSDLVHSLASTSPLWGRVPRVTTIHDINYLVVPQALHRGPRAGDASARPGVRAPLAADHRRRGEHAARSGRATRRRRVEGQPAQASILTSGPVDHRL